MGCVYLSLGGKSFVPHSGTLVSLLEVPRVNRCGLKSSVPCPVSPCSIFPSRPDAGGYGYLKHRSICCPRSPNAWLSRRYVFVIKQVQHLWSNYCMPTICWRCSVAVQHLWSIYCMLLYAGDTVLYQQLLGGVQLGELLMDKTFSDSSQGYKDNRTRR